MSKPKASHPPHLAPGHDPGSTGSAASVSSAPVVRLGMRSLKLSNLQKVLYPTGFTKGQVIDYYRAIAPVMLPHLKDRPVTLKRYPNGVESKFFYEKRCPSHKPEWVKTAKVWSEHNDDWLEYCLLNNAASLVWVANLAALELHTLLGKARDVNRPTMIVFDLDPGPPATLQDCIRVAMRMRELLAPFGLQSFPKTSGGKGLHLYIPLNTPVTFEQTKPFAQAVAMLLEKDDPRRVISSMSRAAREGKVFIDWSQNDEHKTTACAYTLRARPRPTVSTPLTWEEVETADRRRSAGKLVFQTRDVLARVEKHGDLFEPVRTTRQRLPKLSGLG